jgi:hypothetical protein
MIDMHGIQSIEMEESVLSVMSLLIGLIVGHQSDLNSLLHGKRSKLEA